MKWFGIVAFVGLVALAVAHFTGVANVSNPVEVTEHGRKVASEQLNNVKEGVNEGIDVLREKIHEETAPETH